MPKELKRALMDAPAKPDGAFNEIYAQLDVPTNRRARFGGLVAALLLLTVGLVTYMRGIETKVSETYVAAEEVESELEYIVDYYSGENVEDEFDDYAFSSDF